MEKRYNELDSLRGLAASTVVLGHLALLAFAVNAPPSWLRWRELVMLANRTPLTLLMSGGAAVRFFFVLSGFVLMLPFLRYKENPYFPYLVKRICRIYLPYLAAVAVALAGDCLLGHHPLSLFGGSLEPTWAKPTSWKLIVQHVVMLGRFDAQQFDTVLWSLVQEMRISILYPLIALAVLKLRRWKLLALVIAIEAGVLAVPFFFPHADISLVSYPMTLHFSCMFTLGAWLAMERERIREWMQRMSKPAKAWLAGVAFLMYSMGVKTLWGDQIQLHLVHRIEGIHTITRWANVMFLGYFPIWVGDWVATICAAIAICFALTDRRTKKVLNHKLVLLTGRASYSLYLVHAIVLYTLLYLLWGTHYFVLLLPGYFVFTILLTIVFYRWIEIPSMKLGRYLAKRMTAPVDSAKPLSAAAD
ncbi:MAG TPA: acyltransferase [Acidobacteriaceae bacterium]|nr:acyltransferase [Acidobacteriaceae bacterium]